MDSQREDTAYRRQYPFFLVHQRQAGNFSFRFNLSGRQYTEKVYDCFVEMTNVHKLFHYSDFGFLDEQLYARPLQDQWQSCPLYREIGYSALPIK